MNEKNDKSNGTHGPITAGSEQKEEPLDEFTRKLVEGTAEPPNEYAAFIVGKLREVMMKGEQAGKQLSQLRFLVNQTEERIHRLQGAAGEYAKDLKVWAKSPKVDKEVAKKEAPAEGEKNEVTP